MRQKVLLFTLLLVIFVYVGMTISTDPAGSFSIEI